MFKIGDLICTNNKKLVGVIVDIHQRTAVIEVMWNYPKFATGCKTYTTTFNNIQPLQKGTGVKLKLKTGNTLNLKYSNYDSERKILYGQNNEVLLLCNDDELEFNLKDEDVTTNDAVNHPSHYTQGKIEVIDYIEDKKLGYHLGNVVKYVSRAGHKNNALEDLKKARWYLDRMIKNMEEN